MTIHIGAHKWYSARSRNFKQQLLLLWSNAMERLFECLPVKYIILLLVVSADTYLHRCLCSSPSCLSRGCTLTSTLSMQPGFPLQTVVFFSCLSLPPSYDSSCKHSAMYSYSSVDSESSGKSFGRLILSPFAAQTLREREERERETDVPT